MNPVKTFCVTYPNGHMEVNVSEFFGTATLANIKKFLRFASKNCTVEMKTELINDILYADLRKVECLRQLDKIEAEWCELASQAVGRKVYFENTSLKKELRRQRAKLAKSRELIKEVWPD